MRATQARFSHERLFSSYVLALNELSYEKFVPLTLMKLTAGVNFSNIYEPPFVRKCFKQLFSNYSLALKKIGANKFSNKLLMKLTTGINFIKISQAAFCQYYSCNEKKIQT